MFYVTLRWPLAPFAVASGTGTLNVEEGALVCHVSRRWPTQPRIVRQTAPNVHIGLVRLTVPWFSVHVVVHDEDNVVVAMMPRWKSKPLVELLIEIGFSPRVERVWLPTTALRIGRLET
jgi:hypothetical protein